MEHRKAAGVDGGIHGEAVIEGWNVGRVKFKWVGELPEGSSEAGCRNTAYGKGLFASGSEAAEGATMVLLVTV